MDGPLTVAEFMTACLHDLRHGYYANHPSLGPRGDFITAPLVSQMFGELVGAWMAEVWRQMGSPAPVQLVELGPGDGTLMDDALRVLRHVPGLLGAAELWLVEPSRPLRALQAERLAYARPRFADTLAELPPGAPLILVANEVFDCLPTRQFVRAPGGWAERRIGLGAAGELAFGLSPPPSGAAEDLPADAYEGAVAERSPAQAALAAEIGARVAEDGGAALVVDYGRAETGYGDTLQALSRHARVDPLASAGVADLTVHVDFPALAEAARVQGAAVSPVASQRAFLRRLGVEARAAALARSRPDQAEVIARQLHRLTAPDQMGELFKVVSIHTQGLAPPGFTPQEGTP
ncbi:class I SAM-dependent methyltransferase [Caulobacter sp. S45]|uniref:class I SAM-dependent methyltransferase n=1 Tax=Caulobacter sp. S45 TaxID=1641861 RepID=UPI0015769826|nr:SAM-dependent methyltransferase [Caulobacter sp. S45]